MMVVMMVSSVVVVTVDAAVVRQSLMMNACVWVNLIVNVIPIKQLMVLQAVVVAIILLSLTMDEVTVLVLLKLRLAEITIVRAGDGKKIEVLTDIIITIVVIVVVTVVVANAKVERIVCAEDKWRIFAIVKTNLIVLVIVVATITPKLKLLRKLLLHCLRCIKLPKNRVKQSVPIL